jgi:hypothetical protein
LLLLLALEIKKKWGCVFFGLKNGVFLVGDKGDLGKTQISKNIAILKIEF